VSTSGPTKKSRVWEVMRFITKYIDSNGYPPSLRIISREANVYPSSVVHYVNQLEEWGYIQRGDDPRRLITVTEKGREL